MNADADLFFENADTWRSEMLLLRKIALDCGLTEEFKWKHPCYTYLYGNVVLIHGFKEYCALLFYKGVLISDPENILIQQTKNVQSGRQIRFNDIREIRKMETILKAYIFEAIEVEKKGLKVAYKKSDDFEMVEEFRHILKIDPKLNAAYKELTPGRQRAYLLYFSQAKQSATRLSRIKRYRNQILNGKGINDCICGHSGKKPSCDGSHKQFGMKNNIIS